MAHRDIKKPQQDQSHLERFLTSDKPMRLLVGSFFEERNFANLRAVAKNFHQKDILGDYEQENKTAKEETDWRKYWNNLLDEFKQLLYKLVESVNDVTQKPVINQGLVKERPGKLDNKRHPAGFPPSAELDDLINELERIQNENKKRFKQVGFAGISGEVSCQAKNQFEILFNFVLIPLHEYLVKQQVEFKLPRNIYRENIVDLAEDQNHPLFLILNFFKKFNLAKQDKTGVIKRKDPHVFGQIEELINGFQLCLDLNLLKAMVDYHLLCQEQKPDGQRQEYKQDIAVVLNQKEMMANRIKELLAKGAQINRQLSSVELPKDDLSYADSYYLEQHKLTYFDIVFMVGNVELLALLIKLGVSITEEALLHMLNSKQNNKEGVKLLLAHGAQITTYEIYTLAIQKCDLEVVKMLFAKKLPDYGIFDIWEKALFQAMETGKIDILEYVTDMFSALVSDNQVELRKKIIELIQSQLCSGKSYDAKILRVVLDKLKINPESLSFFKSGLIIFDLKIGKGVIKVDDIAEVLTGDRDRTRYLDMTPLMLAAACLDADHVEVLIRYGADPLLQDEKGRTALDYATLIMKCPCLAPLNEFVACANEAASRYERIKKLLTPKPVLEVGEHKQEVIRQRL